MRILFLILTSKTYYYENCTYIDRPDLTRKLDAINTWVMDAIDMGHDIVFFDGGNEIESYDEDSKTLHLIEDDGYETKEISVLYPKVKSALRWVYENKDFDLLFLGDDDIYINLKEFIKVEFSHDYMGVGSYGGGGFFFNKKSIEVILHHDNHTLRVCDQVIYNAICNNNSITKNFNFEKSSVFYFPGELYATMHYVTGKRAYFIHNILKYYHENGYTNRKIILGGPLDSMKRNSIISYETTHKRKTYRFYDFTTDPNGWEYHGGYLRSMAQINNLKNFWPYAKNSTKYFVINHNVMLHDYIGYSNYKENFDFLVSSCEESLIDKKNLFLCSEKEEYIDGWVLDNSIKEKYKLNFELLDSYFFYKKNSY